MSDTSKNLRETQNTIQEASKLNTILKTQLSQASQTLSKSLSINSAVTLVVSKTKEAISELKEMNTLLTQISRFNQSLSKSDLQRIGSQAWEAAGRYGKTASDYLSAYQEASAAGYHDAQGIAELSLAAQNAGGMTASLADQLIAATNKAYKMNGSVTQLTNALDGISHVAGQNKIHMSELADGISSVGSTAASFGLDVDETTAALSTIIAATGQSGSEAAGALQAILFNIRQVTDEGDGIDTTGLAKYEEACRSLNVSLNETKNGVTSLRDPMDVLKDLSILYSRLAETDVRKTDLLDSVGSVTNADALDALLKNYDSYSKMLVDYVQGPGSMAAEAELTANSWEGSLNRLGSSWTSLLGTIVNTDGLVSGINGLNSLIDTVQKAIDTFGLLPIAAIAAYTAVSTKNGGGLIRLVPQSAILLS